MLGKRSQPRSQFPVPQRGWLLTEWKILISSNYLLWSPQTSSIVSLLHFEPVFCWWKASRTPHRHRHTNAIMPPHHLKVSTKLPVLGTPSPWHLKGVHAALGLMKSVLSPPPFEKAHYECFECQGFLKLSHGVLISQYWLCVSVTDIFSCSL